MQVTTAKSFFPKPLSELIKATPEAPALTPGFLIGVDHLLSYHPPLNQSLLSLYPHLNKSTAPCFVVPPQQVATAFETDQFLSVFRKMTNLALESAPVYLKTGVKTVWFIYDAKKLYDEWQKPDRDIAACCFKTLGIGVGGASLAGDFYSDLKIPDRWANGINFIAVGGEKICLGKIPPIAEMALGTDKSWSIPLSFMKLAGVSLDPNPQLQSITATPLLGFGFGQGKIAGAK